MFEIRCAIPAGTAQPLEDYFCELTCSPWMLFSESVSAPVILSGFFDTSDEATDAWADLCKLFPVLPSKPEIGTLADRDWKEAYKAGLHPWSHGPLHWVPEWRRAEYIVPPGAAVVYFDAGLAFGTGDHPTTRLCAMRLLDFWEAAGPERQGRLRVTDAGCGSGILALSAAKLGAGSVNGFDRDEEAVRVSRENRSANNLPERAVRFSQAGLERGLREAGEADVVLANIISDVLRIYADDLVSAVAPGGVLALGGILAHEVEAVRKVFEPCALSHWKQPAVRVDSRTEGDWSDLALFRD
ncbi:MAG: 50S ribosomal protein L11 methyltransferase [Puniceicoccales bacterium]|jgi:ribosomal protein L11 methyltransferase|nr:50S ribosomal protein L11 methyltransferase [Puniceicoccales bacterium]